MWSLADQAHLSAAIRHELAALRASRNRQTIPLVHGYPLDRGDEIVYFFEAERPVGVPEGSPARVCLAGSWHDCVVVSARSGHVLLQLESRPPPRCTAGELEVDGSGLLLALEERLRDLDHWDVHGLGRRLALPLRDDPAVAAPARRVGASPAGVNHEQVAFFHVAATRPRTYLWGPPGTGKTKTLGAVVADLATQGLSVLLVGSTNTAVDQALASTLRVLDVERGLNRCIRAGYPAQPELLAGRRILLSDVARDQEPELAAELSRLDSEVPRLRRRLDAQRQDHQLARALATAARALAACRKELRHVEADLIGRAQVVATSVVKAYLDDSVYQREYDVVVIDEASMIRLAHLVAVASRASVAVVIAGDPRQLPPIVQSDTDSANMWLRRDAFTAARATSEVRHDGTGPVVALREQYRMPASVADIIGTASYAELGGFRRAAQPREGRVVVLDSSGAATSIAGPRGSRWNPFHVLLAKHHLQPRLEEWEGGTSALLSPYRLQQPLLGAVRRHLVGDDDHGRHVVSTIHGMQGGESDLVLLDLVEAPGTATHSTWFGADLPDEEGARLLNVRSRGAARTWSWWRTSSAYNARAVGTSSVCSTPWSARLRS